TDLALVLVMLVAYLLARRYLPRYAVVVTLAAGVLQALASDRMAWQPIPLALAQPVFTAPEFSVRALVGMALPLFVVTMASQNLPGVAAIRAAGYAMPISRLVAITGLATLLLAPFGGYALCLSAITAAICMGPQAHEDPARRYTAAVVCGVIYLAVGLFGGAVAGTLGAFPKELVSAIAGLALLGTIGSGLSTALADEGRREAALLTFLVTTSGVVIAGIGSAFWGLAAGALALFVQHYGRSRA
ncbi:MAG: benzoate transporter BenE, partial [Betaproteobacteria bacterium]|nr:benzoate transporter BenE [Betaproteobacteria bacterium]